MVVSEGKLYLMGEFFVADIRYVVAYGFLELPEVVVEVAQLPVNLLHAAELVHDEVDGKGHLFLCPLVFCFLLVALVYKHQHGVGLYVVVGVEGYQLRVAVGVTLEVDVVVLHSFPHKAMFGNVQFLRFSRRNGDFVAPDAIKVRSGRVGGHAAGQHLGVSRPGYLGAGRVVNIVFQGGFHRYGARPHPARHVFHLEAVVASGHYLDEGVELQGAAGVGKQVCPFYLDVDRVPAFFHRKFFRRERVAVFVFCGHGQMRSCRNLLPDEVAHDVARHRHAV